VNEALAVVLDGGYVAVLAPTPAVGVEGRLAGLELRDALCVLRPGPSMSYVFLFRKPLSEPTVAEQVLKTGTGALHIDACRVGKLPYTEAQWHQKGLSRPTVNTYGVHKGSATDLPTGRWPSNFVLVHGPACVETGTRRVKSSPPIERTKAAGFHPDNRVFGTGEGEFHSTGYADADGLETVAAWECEPGCPVGLLDAQRPHTAVTGQRSDRSRDAVVAGTKFATDNHRSREYPGDTGGTSRFFPQFRDEAELRAWVERLLGASCR
jgi:hypothetical protein